MWNKTVQGLILGSFFWGYIVTQIPGGWLATRIGGKRVYGLSMLLATVATFLTPVAAQTSYIFLIVLRILVGIASVSCYTFVVTSCKSLSPALLPLPYWSEDMGTCNAVPFNIMLCFGSIGMDRVIYESCFKGTVLQRNYKKMAFSCILFSEVVCKKKMVETSITF